MPNNRRRFPIGAFLLILFGLLLLYSNIRPEWNPWPILSRYWPLLLIFWGLGKLWDHFRIRGQPGSTEAQGPSGVTIALLILTVIFTAAIFRDRGRQRTLHDSRSVERQGAETVIASIEMGAGDLHVASGSMKLLEAEFDYNERAGTPRVRYDLSGKEGRLKVTQNDAGGVHWGRTFNRWNLRFSDDLPLDLSVEMGAGQGDLRLSGLALRRLDIEMGAGQVTVDLTGDWKKDFDVNIQGGVGTATVRLPRNAGVRVHASGGIGTINAHGLERDGDSYVNAAYGHSAVTLNVSVEGGVGQINLVPES